MSDQLLDVRVAEFNRLREMLAADAGLDVDDEAVIDTAEGETSLDGLLAWMVRAALQRAAQAEVCAKMAKALTDRKRRHEAAEERLRGLVAQAMLSTGIKKLAPGDLTATARLTAPGVEVIDEELVPAEYTKTIVKPDLAALRAELHRCNTLDYQFDVPGVAVTSGRPSLVVRV